MKLTKVWRYSCELLSKLSIFDTTNNPNFTAHGVDNVVNCFQNLVSLIRQTTQSGWILMRNQVVNCFQNLVSLIRQTTVSKFMSAHAEL